MANETTDPLYLNCNATMPVRLRDGMLEMDFSSTDSDQFWRNVSGALALQADAGTMPATEVDAYRKLVRVPLAGLPREKPIRILLRGQPVAEFSLGAGDMPTITPTPHHAIYQLIVAETRGLSHHLSTPAPQSPPYDRQQRLGFDPQQHAPITDLHTHLSAQLRPRDLFEIALTHDKAATDNRGYVTYPVELLERIAPGTTLELPQLIVNSVEFTPLKGEGLACEQGKDEQGKAVLCKAIRLSNLTPAHCEAIIDKMDASETQTKNFQRVERDIYRYSNPLSKNPQLTKAMIRKVAEGYARDGIEYAELATGAMLNPEWFQQMVEAVDEIEHGTLNADGSRNDDAITVGAEHRPLRLRFLVGLPRQKTPEETMKILERSKFLLRHPYIVGIDLMGNEMNGTSDFHWALSHMAQWARQSEGSDLNPQDGWNFQEDCLIRVHAGETAKNPKNVSDALRIAHDHQVRVRVGHGQNALLKEDDQRILRQMRMLEGRRNPENGEKYPHHWFGMEICSDSNQFYQMWPQVHQVVMRARHALSHIFLGSDGNGMVHSSPRQLAFSALAAGLSLDDLAQCHTYEQRYIVTQKGRDERKTKAFIARYPGGNGEFFDAYQAFNPDAVIQDRFAGKTPILIGGAGGDKSSSSWHMLDKLGQRQIEQMMHLLVATLDPKKTYFVLGRVQNEGVSKALDVAVMRYNQQHPDNKFAVMARYANAHGKDTPMPDLPESVSGLQRIPGDIDAVPNAMIDYIHQQHGYAFFFAGAHFTGDMIVNCLQEDRHVPFWAFMPEGSEVKNRMATIIPPRHHLHGTEDLLNILAGRNGQPPLTDPQGNSLLRGDIDLKNDETRAALLAMATTQTSTGRRGHQRRPVGDGDAALVRS